eukprot:68191-Rhodomonas_salina.2
MAAPMHMVSTAACWSLGGSLPLSLYSPYMTMMVVKRRNALNIGTLRYLSAITPEMPYVTHPSAIGSSFFDIANVTGKPYFSGLYAFRIETKVSEKHICATEEGLAVRRGRGRARERRRRRESEDSEGRRGRRRRKGRGGGGGKGTCAMNNVMGNLKS